MAGTYGLYHCSECGKKEAVDGTDINNGWEVIPYGGKLYCSGCKEEVWKKFFANCTSQLYR